MSKCLFVSLHFFLRATNFVLRQILKKQSTEYWQSFETDVEKQTFLLNIKLGFLFPYAKELPMQKKRSYQEHKAALGREKLIVK